MKCLFVISDLARAGAEKQAALLARGLKALGWSVSIVLVKERNDFAEFLAKAAIPVRPLNRRGPLDVSVVRRLRRAIAETSPDVVVSFLFLANLLTVLATCARRGRPGVVVSVRASYRSTLTPVQRLVARLSHRCANLVVFNSRAVQREEQTAFPRALRTTYLPNAVVETPAQAVDWRSLGITTGPVIASVGQLTPVKGHRILIEAFASVSESNPAARLVLIGDGPEEERLHALVRTKSLSDRVTFLGHQEHPLPFMSAADIFVQPSLSEGMSNSLMEAMSLGRCIVATRVGAAPDLLEDGVHALLCRPVSSDLAAAMSRALGDAALRERLGQSARQRSRDFSVDRIASDLDAMLRGVVQRNSIPLQPAV